jgi:hypothetical protein
MANSKYRDDMPLLVEQYAREGLREVDIADKLGVSMSTLSTYKLTYPAILEALKNGKAVIDSDVEMKLLTAAMGSEYTEVKTIEEGGKIIRTETTVKFLVPSVTAQIFWLKNRQPEQWRDVSRVEHLDLRKALDQGKADLIAQGDKRVAKAIEADYSVLTDAPSE